MPKEKRRVPREDGPFNVWYKTFKKKLPDLAATVGISADKVARVENDSAAFNYMLERGEIVGVNKKAETEARGDVGDSDTIEGTVTLPAHDLPAPPAGMMINRGVKKYANMIVKQILENENCTPEIEAQLGIELKGGGEPDTITGKIKEIISGNGGQMLLKCLMQGFKGYRVYSMRGDETEFHKIGDSMQEEFTDDRPNQVPGQPEKRLYKIIMLEKNQPVGEYSDVKETVTKP